MVRLGRLRRRASPASSPAASASASRWPARSSTGPRVLLLDEPLGALDLKLRAGDAGRAQAHPARGRHHVRLRDPRPGGGADDERPPRGLQRAAGSSRSGRPAEVYERPATRVRRRLRRHVEPARGDGGAVIGRDFTVRPEKIRLVERRTHGRRRRASSAPGRCATSSTSGRSRATSSTLDAGGELRSSRSRTSRPPRRRSLEPRRGGAVRRGLAATSTTLRASQDGATRRRRNATRRTHESACGASPIACGRSAVVAAADRRGGGTPSGGAVQGADAPPKASSSAPGEGELNIIAWAGYAEDGSTDPKVDWVTPFEKQTGCKVNVKSATPPTRWCTLMQHRQLRRRLGLGRRDAAPDRRRRRRAGQHRPRPELRRRLRRPEEPAVQHGRRRQMYGIPHGRGANLLMWQHRQGQAGADELGRGVRRRLAVQGQGHASTTSPIYIADAALYLKATKPDLKITNPYELDQTQFDAAVDLLKTQRQNIGEYWSDYTKEQAAFTQRRLDGRHDLAGHRQPARGRQGQPVKAIAAQGGRDRLVGHLDDLVQGQAPELHVQVDELDHLAEGQRPGGGVVRRGAGQREGLRAETLATRTTARPSTPTTRRTSTRSSSGRRRAATAATTAATICKDYADWVQAWTDIKG